MTVESCTILKDLMTCWGGKTKRLPQKDKTVARERRTEDRLNEQDRSLVMHHFEFKIQSLL